MNQKITIGPVRLSFPHLFTPFAFSQGDEPMYRTQILWEKGDKNIEDKVRAAIKAAVKDKWGDDVPDNLALPIRDGDDQPYDSHKDMNFMTVKTKETNKPQILDANLNPIIDKSEIYAGCWVYISIYMHPYDYAGKKGVTALLNNVMKFKDDEPLGGGADAKDDFADVAKTTATGDDSWL